MAGLRMANDPPTNLRMGFGYHQARAAGLGGVRASRSPRQVNRIIEENKADRWAVQALRDAAKEPKWAEYLTHRVAEGCGPQVIWDELERMKAYSKYGARGYSLSWCLRHWTP
jgi:hypothetical protein